jgi:two-component system sensor histidine kinase UhpB
MLQIEADAQIEALAARIPGTYVRPSTSFVKLPAVAPRICAASLASCVPKPLEDLGLQSALAALATSFGEHARVPVDRRLEVPLPLSADEEIVVYRVAQEALTNVAPHAEATRVELRLEQNDGVTVLTVRDDGRGLSPGALHSAHGIRGMRERAMLIGALLQINSKPGCGTEIKLSIPIELAAPAGQHVAGSSTV